MQQCMFLEHTQHTQQTLVTCNCVVVHAFECSEHHLLSPRPPPLPPWIGRQNLCAGRAGRDGRKGTPKIIRFKCTQFSDGQHLSKLMVWRDTGFSKTFSPKRLASLSNLLRHLMTHLNWRSVPLSTNVSHPSWTSWLLSNSCIIISKIWQKILINIFSSRRSICQDKASHMATNDLISIPITKLYFVQMFQVYKMKKSNLAARRSNKEGKTRQDRQL